uniref:Uncharacterized protein n=1 Tax=Cannabis sativa TaxID=3483 RepID=A0A803RA82_CANSA
MAYNLNMEQSTRVNALECDCNPIWVRTRNIKGSYTTNFAKGVFCSVSTKGVSCEKLIGITQKFKSFSRDNEVCVTPHVAI